MAVQLEREQAFYQTACAQMSALLPNFLIKIENDNNICIVNVLGGLNKINMFEVLRNASAL